jgi:5-methylcytosine-specific restriction endonuclease McrA
MPAKKKIQYKDYADYLKSDKWKQVKEDYKNNESIDNCLCCRDQFNHELAANYHHFKYSKNWSDDTWENLIVVCIGCHNQLHERFPHSSDPITLREYLSKVTATLISMTRDNGAKLDKIHELLS